MPSPTLTAEDRRLLESAFEGYKLETEREANMNTKAYVSGPPYKAPGRLGDPRMTIGTDPRLNAKIKPVLAQFGADKNMPSPALTKLNAQSSFDEIAETIRIGEQGIMMMYDNAPVDLPSDKDEPELEMKEVVIPGGDGQDMKLYIYSPKVRDGSPLPCLIYSHGGGMVLIPTMNKVHDRWSRSLAASGMVVVMTDFRNAWTKEGYNHFPAGLNDCAAAVQWVHSKRDELKIKNIVLQGESGGGNLAIATTLKAKKEGWLEKISGVYASIPYISGGYGWTDEEKLKRYPSLVECNGYVIHMQGAAIQAWFYSPTAADQKNPLAWPANATVEDLKGLPPHILSMDELDPLRDEGIAYARKLIEAGVSAKGHVNLGVGHGIGNAMRAAAPEYWATAVRDISGFAKSL